MTRRTTTNPQRSLGHSFVRPIPETPPEGLVAVTETEEQEKAIQAQQRAKLRDAIEGGGFTVNDLVEVLVGVADTTVRRTRADSKLLVDASVGLATSQVSAAISDRRSFRQMVERGLTAASLIAALVMGVWRVVFTAAYESASIDAIEPARRAEAKATQAAADVGVGAARSDVVDTAISARVTAAEGRVTENTEAIGKLSGELHDTTRLVSAIAVKMGIDIEPEGEEPTPRRKKRTEP